MTLKSTRFVGLYVGESKRFVDSRGVFFRAFCRDELREAMGERNIAQINHSQTSSCGAVRGMHFQYPPHAEMKLIRCLRGRVADVAVDLRSGSATFLEWHMEELSSVNGRTIVIPEGFAHGFQVLEPESELLYLHTAPYRPAAESAIRFDDPKIGIQWPLPITDISDRDRSHALLPNNFCGIELTT